MNLLKYIYFVIFIIILQAGNAAADLQVFAQVDTSEDIYVGERFAYHVIIDGENKPGQVDISPLAKYSPQNAGSRDVSQTSISIINGKTTQNITKRYVMSYSLVSSRPGQIQLPPVTVTIDGKSYQTNPVRVTVSEPGTTDRLDLEVSLSDQQCYVGQPVIMTVKFYISADIGDFQFNIPVFSSDSFYIEDPDISNPQAKAYDLGNGVIVHVNQYRTTHKGRDSILLSFSKVLIPKQPGKIEILPATVSADIAVGVSRTRDGFFDDSFFDDFFGRKEYKRFMVTSEPLKLKVLDLPQENKPEGFYGLVGNYTISASAGPTRVNVGDPITLTIKIGGSKFLKPVRWPALEKIPELANNFKIPSEKATPTVENGYKVFTQTIRANNDKVTKIPPIRLAYFATEKGKYEVAETKPINLEVAPTKILTGADLQGRNFSPVNKEVEAIKKGLSANYEDLDALNNQVFSPLAAAFRPGYMLIWAGPLILLAVSAVAKFVTHTSPEKIAARRRRTAAGKAISQLKRITSASNLSQYELLASVMKQYIGDRFDRTAGTLTSDECFEIIFSSTNDMQIADKYKEIIAGCEAARYTSSKININHDQITETIKLIRTIDKKCRK